MSLADCLDIETQAVAATAPVATVTTTIETTPVYGEVGRLPTDEAVVDAKAAQNEWTDHIAKHAMGSSLPFIRELEGLETTRKHWEVTEMAASHARTPVPFLPQLSVRVRRRSQERSMRSP